MDLINPEIEAYAEQHTSPESELVRGLVEASYRELEHIDMISGRVVGRLLAMLVKISGARRVLEIGTFSGYSALSMAEALPPEGELITCEYNERYEQLARSFISKSGFRQKIRLEMGPALETLSRLNGSFDMAFIDADKVNYPAYYIKVLPMIKKGGLIIVDNVLWAGTVLDPDDEKSEAIDRINKMISNDDRVEQVMLTVRDGLTIVRKKY